MTTTMGILALAGAGLLGVTAVVTRLLDGGSAAMRHLLWTVVLAMLVLAPALELSGLRIEVPVPGSWLGAEVEAPAPPGGEGLGAAPSPAPVPHAAPAAARGGSARVTPGLERAEAGRALVPATSRVGTPRATAAESSGLRSQSSGLRSQGSGVVRQGSGVVGRGFVAAAPIDDTEAGVGRFGGLRAAVPSISSSAALGVVWALGTLVLLCATLFSHVAARRLSVHGVERADPETARRFAALVVARGLRRPVRLVVSPSIRVPATWGFLRPTVVLPPQYQRWSRETLERVLLHELAHAQRGDCWTYLVGEVARAIHWPNPLAWYALHRLRAESEHACDDQVLEHGSPPSAYAADLLALVRSLRADGRLPEAALAMARPSGLGRRVRAVLDPEQPRRGPGRGSAAGMVTAACLACLGATVVVPVAMAQERPPEPPTPVEPPAPPTPVEPPAPVEPRMPGGLSTPPAPPEAVAPPAEPTRVRWDEPAEPVAAPPVPEVPAPTGPMRVDDLRYSPSANRVWVAAEGARVGPETTVRFASLASMALPSLQSREHCVFDGDGRRSTSVNTDEGWMRIRWETDGCRVDIDIEGEVEFAADDSGIAAMDRDALFDIEERVGRDRRRVRMAGAAAGRIERRFWVDGDEVAWGPEAEEWLAGILPLIFRHTTINAEARVRRMLAEGGPDRVFSEVEDIFSDHVSRRYLEILMEEADLTEREYTRVIDFASRIDSDHGSAELMLAVVDRAGLRPGFQDPMLRATTRIDSDHQKSRVLQALLASDLTASQFDEILRVASAIDSDHQLGEILMEVARRSDLTRTGRASYLDAVRSIESDHQRGMVINAFLDEGAASDAEVLHVLSMTEGIESDHQRSEVLQRVAREHDLDGAQVEAFLASARGIESDHQMAVTAQALIDSPAFDETELRLVLDLVDTVDSDHQAAMILHALIQARDLRSDEIEWLLRATEEIESDHQASVTLEMLIDDEQLDGASILAVLGAARHIESSHQRASVLQALAGRHTISGEALGAYEDLAADLSSHDRDQALRAVGRARTNR